MGRWVCGGTNDAGSVSAGNTISDGPARHRLLFPQVSLSRFMPKLTLDRRQYGTDLV